MLIRCSTVDVQFSFDIVVWSDATESSVSSISGRLCNTCVLQLALMAICRPRNERSILQRIQEIGRVLHRDAYWNCRLWARAFWSIKRDERWYLEGRLSTRLYKHSIRYSGSSTKNGLALQGNILVLSKSSMICFRPNRLRSPKDIISFGIVFSGHRWKLSIASSRSLSSLVLSYLSINRSDASCATISIFGSSRDINLSLFLSISISSSRNSICRVWWYRFRRHLSEQ